MNQRKISKWMGRDDEKMCQEFLASCGKDTSILSELLRQAAVARAPRVLEVVWNAIVETQKHTALTSSDEFDATAVRVLSTWAKEPWVSRFKSYLTPSDYAVDDVWGTSIGILAASHANWDMVEGILNVHPETSKQKSQKGDVLLDLMAQPSYYHRVGATDSEWVRPPVSLWIKLINLGPELVPADPKRISTLARVFDYPEYFEPLLEHVLSQSKWVIQKQFERGAKSFSLLANCVQQNRQELFDRLSSHPSIPYDSTATGFSLVRFALKHHDENFTKKVQAYEQQHAHQNNQADLARTVLADQSLSEDKKFASVKELAGSEHVWDRDLVGHNILMYAIKNSSLSLFQKLWDIAPERAKMKGQHEPFGLLEGALKSKLEAESKMDFLLGAGLAPARLRAPVEKAGKTTEGKLAASTGSTSIAIKKKPVVFTERNLSVFDGMKLRKIMIDAMYDTEPESALDKGEIEENPIDDGADWSSFGNRYEKEKDITTRPSFLSQVVKYGSRTSLGWYVEGISKGKISKPSAFEVEKVMNWALSQGELPQYKYQFLLTWLEEEKVNFWTKERQSLVQNQWPNELLRRFGLDKFEPSAWLKSISSVEGFSVKPLYEIDRSLDTHSLSVPWVVNDKLALSTRLERYIESPIKEGFFMGALVGWDMLRLCLSESLPEVKGLDPTSKKARDVLDQTHQELLTALKAYCKKLPDDAPWKQVPTLMGSDGTRVLMEQWEMQHRWEAVRLSQWIKTHTGQDVPIRPSGGIEFLNNGYSLACTLLCSMRSTSSSRLGLQKYQIEQWHERGMEPPKNFSSVLDTIAFHKDRAAALNLSSDERGHYKEIKDWMWELMFKTPAWREKVRQLCVFEKSDIFPVSDIEALKKLGYKSTAVPAKKASMGQVIDLLEYQHQMHEMQTVFQSWVEIDAQALGREFEKSLHQNVGKRTGNFLALCNQKALTLLDPDDYNVSQMLTHTLASGVRHNKNTISKFANQKMQRVWSDIPAPIWDRVFLLPNTPEAHTEYPSVLALSKGCNWEAAKWFKNKERAIYETSLLDNPNHPLFDKVASACIQNWIVARKEQFSDAFDLLQTQQSAQSQWQALPDPSNAQSADLYYKACKRFEDDAKGQKGEDSGAEDEVQSIIIPRPSNRGSQSLVENMVSTVFQKPILPDWLGSVEGDSYRHQEAISGLCEQAIKGHWAGSQYLKGALSYAQIRAELKELTSLGIDCQSAKWNQWVMDALQAQIEQNSYGYRSEQRQLISAACMLVAFGTLDHTPLPIPEGSDWERNIVRQCNFDESLWRVNKVQSPILVALCSGGEQRDQTIMNLMASLSINKPDKKHSEELVAKVYLTAIKPNEYGELATEVHDVALTGFMRPEALSVLEEWEISQILKGSSLADEKPKAFKARAL